jgi:formamidopyrimidine-DNA glycosylase
MKGISWRMPELPEVQTIVADLAPILPGRKITSVRYVGALGEELRRRSKIDLSLSLPGKVITGVRRVSKELILDLDSGEVLVFHLRITGRILFRDCSDREDEHMRLLIDLDSSQALRFTDRNGLASAEILSEGELAERVKKYGPEVLSKDLTPEKFLELLHQSKDPSIKETLADQKIVSGLGNIYIDEALFLAKIHPRFPVKQINLSQAEVLFSSAQQVLKEGLTDRGTTIDSYVDAFGKPGTHQDHLRVYGKSGQPCPEGNGTIEYMEVGGRRTFFCPICQALPQLSLF